MLSKLFINPYASHSLPSSFIFTLYENVYVERFRCLLVKDAKHGTSVSCWFETFLYLSLRTRFFSWLWLATVDPGSLFIPQVFPERDKTSMRGPGGHFVRGARRSLSGRPLHGRAHVRCILSDGARSDETSAAAGQPRNHSWRCAHSATGRLLWCHKHVGSPVSCSCGEIRILLTCKLFARSKVEVLDA